VLVQVRTKMFEFVRIPQNVGRNGYSIRRTCYACSRQIILLFIAYHPITFLRGSDGCDTLYMIHQADTEGLGTHDSSPIRRLTPLSIQRCHSILWLVAHQLDKPANIARECGNRPFRSHHQHQLCI